MGTVSIGTSQLKLRDTAVVLGGFQTWCLTAHQITLLDTLSYRYDKVVVLLRTRKGVIGEKTQPLPYWPRHQMIASEYPLFVTHVLYDHRCKVSWSRDIDGKISSIIGSDDKVDIYGDVDEYCGRHRIVESPMFCLDEEAENRTESKRAFQANDEFRCGFVAANQMQRPKCFPTVDCLLTRRDGCGKVYVLMGRKATDPKGTYRFPGGFVDPQKDGIDDGRAALEAAAWREFREEVNGDIEVNLVGYFESYYVNAWRYHDLPSAILTTVFHFEYVSGEGEAADDLDGEELRWMELTKSNVTQIINGHVPIFLDAIARLTSN